MKKEELMNGDIVVTRNGYLGVVLKDGSNDCILYQEIGKDDLDLFSDDLTDDVDDGVCDIMEVYRGGYSFLEIENDDPMPDWSREIGWQHPSAEEREAQEAEFEKQRLQRVEEMRQREAEMQDAYISIIGQCRFGSRAKMLIPRCDAKRFISNTISPVPDDFFNDIELRTIPVPRDKNIVIVYDKTREDEYLNGTLSPHYDDYRKRRGQENPPRETCSIPEIGIELHTCCFACRIDKDGVFQSLEEGDEDRVVDYFPVWWEREKPTELKYQVGDMVEFTADKGGFDEIEGYGKIVMVGRDRYDGRNKYLAECYNLKENMYNDYAFYDTDIAGLLGNSR